MSAAEATGDETGSLLLNQPVVIDNGTYSIKAGFAGSSKPKVSAVIVVSIYGHCMTVSHIHLMLSEISE
jgi:hypothetical protein